MAVCKFKLRNTSFILSSLNSASTCAGTRTGHGCYTDVTRMLHGCYTRNTHHQCNTQPTQPNQAKPVCFH
eukprot:337806-Prorocentrum_minimum.AAC.1